MEAARDPLIGWSSLFLVELVQTTVGESAAAELRQPCHALAGLLG